MLSAQIGDFWGLGRLCKGRNARSNGLFKLVRSKIKENSVGAVDWDGMVRVLTLSSGTVEVDTLYVGRLLRC